MSVLALIPAVRGYPRPALLETLVRPVIAHSACEAAGQQGVCLRGTTIDLQGTEFGVGIERPGRQRYVR